MPRRLTTPPRPSARRLSIEADSRKQEAVALAETIRAWLAERAALADTPADADIQVVLGGDGAVVRAARAVCDVPVLGVDFGQLGFLAHVDRRRWEMRLEQVLADRHTVRTEPTIGVVLEREEQVVGRLWGVQDVVFHAYVVPGGGQQMAMLELYIDGKYLSPLPGDGLIVANGPGSSAYNLAAGGPVLTPGSASFTVTPICAHTPMRGSFEVSAETPITIVQNGRFPINVCVDGQETFDAFLPGDVAHIRADPRRFRLVSFRDVSFYDRFRQRFNYRIRLGHRAPRPHREHPV